MVVREVLHFKVGDGRGRLATTRNSVKKAYQKQGRVRRRGRGETIPMKAVRVRCLGSGLPGFVFTALGMVGIRTGHVISCSLSQREQHVCSTAVQQRTEKHAANASNERS